MYAKTAYHMHTKTLRTVHEVGKRLKYRSTAYRHFFVCTGTSDMFPVLTFKASVSE